MGDRRFDRIWDRWDAKLADGQPAQAALDASPDAELVAMLAATEGESRRLERNVVASALMNRLGRADRENRLRAQARWDRTFHDVAQSTALVAATRKLLASGKQLLESKR